MGSVPGSPPAVPGFEPGKPVVVCDYHSPAGFKSEPFFQMGRRPGHCPRFEQPPLSQVQYFERAAFYEQASVVAFEQLLLDLRVLGAPSRLIRSARRARADEVAHARAMLELAATAEAARHSWPEVPNASARAVTAFELSLENASAGCVGETFGAWLALYQSERAASKQIRAVARRIARDEARHAALAFRIQAWLAPRLSPEERESVDQALRTAILELLDGPWPAESLFADLGLPSHTEMVVATRALTESLSIGSGPPFVFAPIDAFCDQRPSS